MDAPVGNNAAGKRHAGKWIYWRAKQTLGEVACSFQRGRNVCDARDAFPGARALVVAKEKCAVVFDRSAKGTTKLVAQVFRFGFIGRGEKISRIEGAVAVKLKQRPMNAIAARLEYDVNLSSRGASESGIVGTRQHFELMYGIDRRPYAKRIQV